MTALIVFAGSGLISLLVWLLLFAAVIYVVFLILGLLPIPEPVKTIIWIILCLVFLLDLLQHLGFSI